MQYRHGKEAAGHVRSCKSASRTESNALQARKVLTPGALLLPVPIASSGPITGCVPSCGQLSRRHTGVAELAAEATVRAEGDRRKLREQCNFSTSTRFFQFLFSYGLHVDAFRTEASVSRLSPVSLQLTDLHSFAQAVKVPKTMHRIHSDAGDRRHQACLTALTVSAFDLLTIWIIRGILHERAVQTDRRLVLCTGCPGPQSADSTAMPGIIIIKPISPRLQCPRSTCLPPG
ncbi:hypothetical protein NM688_g3199 [Phlebia brevispora]|uniref:Uncharacterized protein n=1 Tax=Phlebia brevispora TaxID=194682 RepID=A0ACC1T742_9APHY|nr:hypothetical protein NM688_g3199 [Phlebia brevispora]